MGIIIELHTINNFEKVLRMLIRKHYSYSYTYNTNTSKLVEIYGNNIFGIMGNDSQLFADKCRNGIIATNDLTRASMVISDYPLQLKIPQIDEELYYLFNELDFLGSKNGEQYVADNHLKIRSYMNYDLR